MNDLTLTSRHFSHVATVASAVLTAFPGTPVAITQDDDLTPAWTLSVGPRAVGGWVWPTATRRDLVVAMLNRRREDPR